MRLRKTIARPERFDDTVFRNKRRPPTIPLYPDLLAAQVIPFEPQEQPAAFPSLPINLSRDGNVDEVKVEPELQPEIIEQELNNQPTESFGCAAQDGLTDHICPNCYLQVRTQWSSLPLSVQYHIFTTLVKHQEYPEMVAISLKLTDEEFAQVKRDVALRKIYQVPLEDVWSYGTKMDNLGLGVMHPDTLNTLIDYLMFADRYEHATADEVEMGRKFLWWLRLDDKIMDSFVLLAVESDGEQIEVDGGSQSPSELRNSPIDSSTDIQVKRLKDIPQTDPAHASIQADIGTPDQSSADTRVENDDNAKQETGDDSVSTSTKSQVGRKSRAQSVRMSIDETGLAVIVSGDNIDQESIYPVAPGGTLQSSRAVSTASKEVPTMSRVVPKTPKGVSTSPKDISGIIQRLYAKPPNDAIVHDNHNPQVFAKHLLHRNFPKTIRTNLLKEDPCKMSNLEHWFVYGTSPGFKDHEKGYGSAPLPADPSFRPRDDILDGSSLSNTSLQRLVTLQNEWVTHKTWYKKSAVKLIETFNFQADLRMERPERYVPWPTRSRKARTEMSLEKRDPKFKPSVKSSSTLGAPRNRVPSIRPQRKAIDKAPNHNDSHLLNVRGATENKGHNPNLPDSLSNNIAQDKELLKEPAFPLVIPQHTPDNRTIQQHTGDSTIAILPSTVHPNQQHKQQYIEPVPFQHKTSIDAIQTAIEQPELRDICNPSGASAAALLRIDAARPASTQAESPGLQAPSYSPISDQDQDSLPIWSRQYVAPKSILSAELAESPTPEKPPVRLPFERSLGASMQGNKLMQKFLDAAAEDVPDISGISDMYATPSKPQFAPDVFQRSNGFNKDHPIGLPRMPHASIAPGSAESNTAAIQENRMATVQREGTELAPEFFQQLTLDLKKSNQRPQVLPGMPPMREASKSGFVSVATPTHVPATSGIKFDIPLLKRSLAPAIVEDQATVRSESSPISRTPAKPFHGLPFTPLAQCFMSKTEIKASSKLGVALAGRKKPGPKPKAQQPLGKATNAVPAKLATPVKGQSTTEPEKTPRTTKPTSRTPATPAPKKASSTTRARKATSSPAQTPTTSTKKRRSDYGKSRSPYKKRKIDP